MRFTFRRRDSASRRRDGRMTTRLPSLSVTSWARIGSAMAVTAGTCRALQAVDARRSRGTRAHAVGDRLNHRGAAAAPRLVRRRPRDGVDREEIVPVYADAVEAVRQGLLSEGL